MKFKEIPYRNPLEIFSNVINEHDNVYLLESIEGPKKLAEFSFVGFDPKKTISVKNGKAKIYSKIEKSELEIEDPLKIIKELVSNTKISNNHFRLIGGAVGYISYDTVRYWEEIPNFANDDLKLPDLEMGIYYNGIVFDHFARKAYYYCIKDEDFKIDNLYKKSINKKDDLIFEKPKTNISKADFEESVKKAKRYITEGDIFQVVLSKRIEFNFKGNLINFYKVLRQINPSPYMFFLKCGGRQIIGASPEMLVRIDKRTVETYPIAGTRPRVSNPKKNESLGEELLYDPKERAEHVMLVDLARNDVGRISKFGSVSVPDYMQVHQYSHVQHIVSRVVGTLSPDQDCFDAFRAMLPAGTVSGAPKIRAMEIIDELEPTRRGPYAGAVGYFSYNGNSDFAITIRTLIAEGNKAYIQVGAGIVADSDPEREWFETEQKAEALVKALNKAGEKM
ncbi:MAG: anthranilate synthase component I [Candidatus Bathyarchaeota archaeon]|nr:anthranilate synthase component I [Candidatus Bathyarchaeota archaeon]